MYKLATKGLLTTIFATAVYGFFCNASLACCCGGDESDEETGTTESRRLVLDRDRGGIPQPLIMGNDPSSIPAGQQSRSTTSYQALSSVATDSSTTGDALKTQQSATFVPREVHPSTQYQTDTLMMYQAGKIKQPVWDALGQESPLAIKLSALIMSVTNKNAVFENIIKKSETTYKVEIYVGVDKSIELIYLDR